jgi:hypothetical protein
VLSITALTHAIRERFHHLIAQEDGIALTRLRQADNSLCDHNDCRVIPVHEAQLA